MLLATFIGRISHTQGGKYRFLIQKLPIELGHKEGYAVK
jgi:hypothetical protein